MSIEIHHYIHPEPDPSAGLLRDALSALRHILERFETMSADLSQLKDAVAANSTVIGSAVTLIQGFGAKLQAAIDAGADPADLQALADELKTQDEALAGAVAANTPADTTVPATTDQPAT